MSYSYEFGDILDARKAPDGHFIVVVGEITKKEETKVMYYMITSRVYTVFKDILAFFNDCLCRKDKHFIKYFNKEKNKPKITSHNHLSQALFLDKEVNYDTCLELDSMIVVNSDPKLKDKAAIESLRSDGKIIHKNRLAKLDALNLIQVIKNSDNVSADKKNKISACFNKVKSNWN